MEDNGVEDENLPCIGLKDGLSASTFAALMQFLPTRKFDTDEEDEANEPNRKIVDSDVCVAYTAKDVSVISDTFKRLQLQHLERDTKNVLAARARILLPLESTDVQSEIHATLITDGVVRIDSLISSDICDRALLSINNLLAHEESTFTVQTQATGFGNVLTRESRWDLYQKDEGVIHELLTVLFGTADTPLNMLFTKLFQSINSEFHELSALICDCGAKSQPIHPDSVFTEEAPMYTVFVALQDINSQMGPTLFLPNTHTKTCHESHKNNATKDDFLASCEYRSACLNKGDVAIMDSRLLHCGSQNDDSRRVLFYFTLRNPLIFDGCNPPIPTGSKWFGVELQRSSLLLPLL